MNNKPKIKDTVIYFHPIIGNVTLKDIIDMLKSANNDVKTYEAITLRMLQEHNISKDTFYSLFHLLTSSYIAEILEDLENNIE